MPYPRARRPGNCRHVVGDPLVVRLPQNLLQLHDPEVAEDDPERKMATLRLRYCEQIFKVRRCIRHFFFNLRCRIRHLCFKHSIDMNMYMCIADTFMHVHSAYTRTPVDIP